MRILPSVPQDFNPTIWLVLAIRDIDAFFSSFSAGLSMRSVGNFIYEDLWKMISNLTQSNENFNVDDSFIMEVTGVNSSIGAGYSRKRSIIGVDTLGQRSIVSIQA